MGLVWNQRHYVLEAEASDAGFSIAVILDMMSDDGKR
jgi:hypothetical protein